MSAGELLHNAGILEQQLQNIFATAKHWNALLLLDEADVFLETRTERNHFMNGIVAVFLRMLERFEGVMFLTTNRASNFDPAILSRIHIIVEYPGLKQDQRMGIWKSSLDRARTAQGPSDLSDEEVAKLAELDFNGRQVCLRIFCGDYGSFFILDQRYCCRGSCAGSGQSRPVAIPPRSEGSANESEFHKSSQWDGTSQ